MGSVRLALALVVVFTHLHHAGIGVGGRNAVQIFYMISGFLISYVLTSARSYQSTRSFYVNRALRIFPVYWIVLLLTIFAINQFESPWKESLDGIPGYVVSFLALANALIFGQDWLFFLQLQGNAIAFAPDFRATNPPLFEYLLVPQAWSLGVELSFYLVAPFILKSKRALLIMLAASMICRVGIYAAGYAVRDPWTYRFFPAELALFLLGACAQQFLLPQMNKALARGLITKSAPFIATLVLLVWILVYPVLPVSGGVKTASTFAIMLLMLPLCFVYQSTSKWDSKLGELSYPIYICHILVIHCTDALHLKERLGEWPRVAIAVLLTLVSAWLLKRLVADPVELLRNRVRRSMPPRRHQPA